MVAAFAWIGARAIEPIPGVTAQTAGWPSGKVQQRDGPGCIAELPDAADRGIDVGPCAQFGVSDQRNLAAAGGPPAEGLFPGIRHEGGGDRGRGTPQDDPAGAEIVDDSHADPRFPAGGTIEIARPRRVWHVGPGGPVHLGAGARPGRARVGRDDRPAADHALSSDGLHWPFPRAAGARPLRRSGCRTGRPCGRPRPAIEGPADGNAPFPDLLWCRHPEG
jgi:hypothetical protein